MKSSFEYLEDLLADNYPIIACESPLQERHRFLIRLTTSCQQVGKKIYIWNLSEDSIKDRRLFSSTQFLESLFWHWSINR